MDLVIPLKETTDGNQELRYALRSWDRTGLISNVILLGHDPAWVRGVTVLPHESAGKCPVGDVLDKMRMALNSGVLRREFIYSNDDIHMATTMPGKSFHRVDQWNDGMLVRMDRDPYTQGVFNETLRVLRWWGWADERIKDFEMHMPVRLQVGDLKGILDAVGHRVVNFRTLYGNIIGEASFPAADVKLREWSTPRSWCFSTSLAAYNSDGFRKWAEALPPSRWER